MSESTSSVYGRGINGISVRGYKSLYEECSIEVRPLTILAGANSSGKSSIIQPLLLLKQTLEATYDPGALLLNGPNLKFTSADQLFSNISEKNDNDSFTIKIQIDDDGDEFLISTFAKPPKQGIQVTNSTYHLYNNTFYEDIPISLGMNHQEVAKILPVFMEWEEDEFPEWGWEVK